MSKHQYNLRNDASRLLKRELNVLEIVLSHMQLERIPGLILNILIVLCIIILIVLYRYIIILNVQTCN